ncbi:MAG TPA: chromosome segregation protein SMC [Spongiibacteraceae bacterium]|jgi:chromosome segregation protein|nr:chromosome segregation protein SMC [Spongiibacteraceae bacterium]HUH38751.1 chromosome segregation protein SMC [Spongiibacteraceae bacterium]
MRLKCIKLAGFKSFVDPTTVSFPTNLSAIVGPNGCGKSNVIDAVRWVMGESSAKNLRGESMTDVIFNGSSDRKPVGQASIELVFDNSDGGLGGEYAAFTEISIKRRVTRDGQSEYYLNGTRCRRKDITDIFLGTGLGPRSYAIIEQGMISKLIEAKPDELRVFIEEAAGISKYKERRRETESRMRRTQENLERLTDLREEMERQLSHLQRQAQAAERYTELKKEERLLRAQLQALQWRELDQQFNDRDRSIKALEVKLEAVIAEQRAVDAAIEKHRDGHGELQDRFNAVQGRYYALGAEIARAEQTIQHQQERARQLRDDLAEAERNLVSAQRHLQEDTEKQTLWREESEALQPEIELLQEQELQSSDTLQVTEERMQDWQLRWDEFNSRAAGPRQQAEVQQSRIQHLEQALGRIQDRNQRLEQERQGLSAGPVEQEVEQLREQLAELELAGEQAQESLDNSQQAIEQTREGNERCVAALDSARGELQTLRGRRASLEALQQAALAQQDAGVGQWLAQHGLADSPRLAEKIKVESGWEQAVETVLGSDLQALAVDDLGGAAEWLESLSSGSLTLLSEADDSAVPAASLLGKVTSGRGLVAELLAGVHCAADLPTAMARRGELGAGESLITPQGIWVGVSWIRVLRERDAQAGVLARQQELEALLPRMVALEESVARLDEERQGHQQALRQWETERDNQAREVQQHARRLGEVRSQLSARQVRIEEISGRRERLSREIDESREQFQIEQENLGEARMLLADAIERMEQDSAAREALLAERDDNRRALDEARQKARHDKDSAHQLAMRQQSLQAQLQSIHDSIERTARQVAQLEERRAQLAGSIDSNDQPLVEVKLELEALLEKRLAVEEELNAARREVDEVEHALRDAERSRHGIEQRANEVRAELERFRVESQGLAVRRRTLQERLIESQFDLDAVLANLPEEANEAGWQEQLESLDRKVQRLGPINLAAIDEYKVQSERKHYLDSQNDDLVEALTTLENAIRRIDKETRNRFKETFDQVNSGLGELFPRVFGGGHAYLEMTSDDLLDTGIAIMARPPGKRNSTIHLLSGGEKALTAIALVFSIFRLNPAPFCMLDEVDAPLDDANVGRYARMVKEMSEHVQFIYITHNKIAMEMADQLMGVTMQEAGVSRLVTVDVEAAAEMAAS